MTEQGTFKLTYATMFNPPQQLHTDFDAALEKIKANLGQEHPMTINGEKRYSDSKHEAYSPIDTRMHLATFQKGTTQDAEDAIAAARDTSPAWRGMNWEERVYLLRKFADIVDRRVYEIAAVVSLEVGKNRMEALGDVAEASEMARYFANEMERNHGYVTVMASDPLTGFTSTNVSRLKPYGVWLVISPFNFPASLTAGPASAALIAGNTVVIKPATNTIWTSTLFMECFEEAGIPAGVVNLVTGPGSSVGSALTTPKLVDGITFTGSKEVGMKIFHQFAQADYVHPIILELGGKNATIVSRNADLEDAAGGIVRSAFGLQGQKCSAGSRVFVERPVYDALVARVVELTQKLSIGDPTLQQTFLGPVIDKKSYQDYQDFVADLGASGKLLTGGEVLTEGDLAHGYYCAPTVAADVPLDHVLWKQEMFLPITMIVPVDSLQEGMHLANDVDYGLTAGFYGTEEECQWFFDNIQAGTVYANRPQGATTGAWPGFQTFGGWKGSGSTGKNGGGIYYLPLYMHEQSQTMVRRA